MTTLEMNYLRHYVNDNKNTIVVFSEDKVSQSHVNKVLKQDYTKGSTQNLNFGSVTGEQFVPFLTMNGGKEVYTTWKGEIKFTPTNLKEMKDTLYKIQVGKPRSKNGVSSTYKFNGTCLGVVK
jgi:hypothetical protein